MEQILVKYLKPTQPRLQIIKQGNWIDLYTVADHEVQRDSYDMLHLGVAIQLPAGYEAIIAPRSSTFKNYGILQANSIGVIDNSYNGDNDWWRFPVYATRHMTIPAHTRVCQFRIIESMKMPEIIEVYKLGNIDRGGFGSTGK